MAIRREITQTSIMKVFGRRKLPVLIVFSFVGLLLSTILGVFVAPRRSNGQQILGTACLDSLDDNGTFSGADEWFYTWPTRNCKDVNTHQITNESQQIVYTFVMPLSKDQKSSHYSRWHHSLTGILHIDIFHWGRRVVPHTVPVKIDARLASRNKNEPENEWTTYASSVIKRKLDCNIERPQMDHERKCDPLLLFELGSVFHDYYLLNIRLLDGPIVGNVTDLWLTTLNQDARFMKVWLVLKGVSFLLTFITLCWYCTRIRMLHRSTTVLESMLLSLGFALCILNLPFEYLDLLFNVVYMLLLEDIKQGIFYTLLFSFWVVLVGEHFMVDEDETCFRSYWRYLTAVVVVGIILVLFDILEQETKLLSPFYTIWSSEFGAMLAVSFVTVISVLAGIYLLFLFYETWEVSMNIDTKTPVIPNASIDQSSHNEAAIYRLKLLMIATLICASVTAVSFILELIGRSQKKWDTDMYFSMSSGFLIGIYGMWNIYYIALLCVYAPSYEPSPLELSSVINFRKDSMFSK
ncbi:hypothetical protein QAD02_011926 [Eretmocerus hayati]|uniref:Uncharacterized protein n=1 Tax=Eretmocerus hayati TaxID=131215 RepID=A0ACC2P2Y3_9HYME|nr:hypothetical protein QAD02_011926 [Eretmocerus hayati]